MSRYKSKHTGSEIDAAIDRAKAGGAIDTLFAGKAPAGYGYGEQIYIVYWSDSDGSQLGAYLDNYIANKFPNDTSGVFRISKFVDYPACLVSGNGGYADVYFNKDTDDYSKFTVIVSFTGPVDVLDDASGCAYQAVLKRTYAGWKQWEYVNPPMELGVEYRTTERYLGKPVYVKLVDFGALPNTASKYVDPNISNFEKLIEPMTITITGPDGAVHDSPLLDDTTILGRSWFKMASGGIAIRTTADQSKDSAVVKLKYTKTTD